MNPTMPPFKLKQNQIDLIEKPLDSKVFLKGPAGSGKTRVAVERLIFLLERGVPSDAILLLLPQRTLSMPFSDALRVAGKQVTILTLAGLARRMTELFWPLVGEQAGFAYPDRSPIFLTLETAQYYMAYLVKPLIETGLFASISIDHNRLYSQVLDNLNKAALVGFSHHEISARLSAAWTGVPSQNKVYEDAQECAVRFRQYCLANNLLDFSLQIEVFFNFLWNEPLCHTYLTSTFHHLIADNLEEEPPRTYDLLCNWLPELDSALLIYDQDGGFRTFLGADPTLSATLSSMTSDEVIFDDSHVQNNEVKSFSYALTQVLTDRTIPLGVRERSSANHYLSAMEVESHRFYPQMLDGVANRISKLILEDSIPPQEIAVLAPYLSDSLRFSLAHRLELLGVPTRSHRPSRALRDEPLVQSIFNLTYLAHPSWISAAPPSRFDLADAFVQAIEGMDLVRARLLADPVFQLKQGMLDILPFDRIKPDLQQRITFRFGERYERIRLWLAEYRQGSQDELDIFISRLFGELLSQPGFGCHSDLKNGEIVANLVESIQKFRHVISSNQGSEGKPIGQMYLESVREGIIAAQYLRSWQEQDKSEAVLLAPAYTYLLSNQPVQVQVWLDIGHQGWFERISQPLTQPYVLSRQWQDGAVWSDLEEQQASRQGLYRLVLGLLRRCRSKVILCHSELGEQGFEQRGPLLYALQQVRQMLREDETSD